MGIIWSFLKEGIYDNIVEAIKEVPNHFFLGLFWLLFHGVILLITYWIVKMIVANWHIGARIAGIWLFIELIYLLGKKLKPKK